MTAETGSRYALAVYDPEDQVLPQLAQSFSDFKILSFFPSGGKHFPNVDFYSPVSDPIFQADTKSADAAAKRQFLQSASTSVIATNDLRGLSIVTTALTELLAHKIKTLVVISKLPMEMITQVATKNERAEL